MSSVEVDPKSGVFQALTIASGALKISALGMIAAMLVTVGNAGGVGSTVAGIARVPFVIGLDRYLPAGVWENTSEMGDALCFDSGAGDNLGLDFAAEPD